MGEDTNGVVKQPQKYGFAAHPENINLKGRPPRGHTLTDLMRQILEENPEKKRALVNTLLEMAAKKDIAAIREVLDRLEGKPLQSIESKDVTELSLSYGHPKPDEPPAEAGGSDTDPPKPTV